MFLLSSCCLCDGETPQCEFTDEFEEVDIRWDVANLPGGTAASFHTNTSIEAMVATGDGSATMRVSPNPGYILVQALVVDPGGSTSTGVTVRRADSTENISLVRVWGTTDGYELRQGTSVLEAFTASGTTNIKLKIVDAQSGTTDVECYVNEVLVHTETGVSFTLPDVLHLGMICEDGGQWNWIHFSPCPPEACNASVTCTGVRMPLSWTLDASGVGGGGGIAAQCGQIAGSSDWILLNGSKVSGLCEIPTCLDGPRWTGAGIGSCQWASVFPTPFLDGFFSPPEPVTSWPVRQERPTGDADPLVARNADLSFFTVPNWLADHEIANNGTELDPVMQIRVTLLGQMFSSADPDPSDTPIAFGLYYSDWFDLSHDFTAEDLEVDLDSSDGCTFPATLTLKPNGNRPLARQFAGCDEPSVCTPFIDEDDLIFTGTLADGDIRVCMSRSFDQSTGVTFWTGTTGNVYGTCVGGVLLTGTVRCGELQEGAITQWLFDLETPEGTFTMPLENITDPFSSADVADTIDLCTGETGLAMVGVIEPCNSSVAEACCPGWGCCGPPTLVVNETWNLGGDTVSVSGTLSYDSLNDKWVGTLLWEFGCVGNPDVSWTNVEIACDGGTFELSYDPGSTPLEIEATAVDCDTFTLTFPVETPVLCDTSTETVDLEFVGQ